jgi:DNA-binding response OmpR family regulator
MTHQVNRILVVDDEPDVVDLVRTVLEIDGFAVETHTEGEQALGRILEDPPDLMILDLMMPGLDGWELLKLMRQDPAACRVPVVILSARSRPQDQIDSLQQGADAYLCKPFSPKELLRQVRQLLEPAESGRA